MFEVREKNTASLSRMTCLVKQRMPATSIARGKKMDMKFVILSFCISVLNIRSCHTYSYAGPLIDLRAIWNE